MANIGKVRITFEVKMTSMVKFGMKDVSEKTSNRTAVNRLRSLLEKDRRDNKIGKIFDEQRDMGLAEELKNLDGPEMAEKANMLNGGDEIARQNYINSLKKVFMKPGVDNRKILEMLMVLNHSEEREAD